MKKNVLKVFLFSCFCFFSYSIIGLADLKPFDSEIEMAFNCPEPSVFDNQGKVIYYYDNHGSFIKRDLCEGEILTPTLDCEFDGWYYDTSYTNKVTATNEQDMVNKEIYDRDGNTCYGRFGVRVYAKCKDQTPTPTPTCPTDINKTYKVHYMVGGTEVESKTFTYGVNASLNINYNVPEGKTFDGWYLDTSYTNKLTTLTTDKLNITETKDNNNCTVGYKDVYLYAKLLDTAKVCPNEDDMEYIIHYVVDGEEIDTDKVKKGTDKELKTIVSKEDCTVSDWYLDKELTNKITSNKISDISVTPNIDADNCIISYNDIYVYAVTTCPEQKNPETGDNIVIYIVGGIILIGLAAVVTKKLLNK